MRFHEEHYEDVYGVPQGSILQPFTESIETNAKNGVVLEATSN